MIQILSSNLPLGMDGYQVSAEDSFIDAFNTPKGSVIGKPDYGTDAHKLKHRSFNSSWIIDFKRCLKDACKHDPRLTYKNALVDVSSASSGKIYFNVYIGFYSIKGVFDV